MWTIIQKIVSIQEALEVKSVLSHRHHNYAKRFKIYEKMLNLFFPILVKMLSCAYIICELGEFKDFKCDFVPLMV